MDWQYWKPMNGGAHEFDPSEISSSKGNDLIHCTKIYNAHSMVLSVWPKSLF